MTGARRQLLVLSVADPVDVAHAALPALRRVLRHLLRSLRMLQDLRRHAAGYGLLLVSSGGTPHLAPPTHILSKRPKT